MSDRYFPPMVMRYGVPPILHRRSEPIIPPPPTLDERLASLEALVRALTEKVDALERKTKRARRKR